MRWELIRCDDFVIVLAYYAILREPYFISQRMTLI